MKVFFNALQPSRILSAVALFHLFGCSRSPGDLAALEKKLVANQGQLPTDGSGQNTNASDQQKNIVSGPIELNLLNLPTLLTPTRDINVQVSGKNLSSYSFITDCP